MSTDNNKLESTSPQDLLRDPTGIASFAYNRARNREHTIASTWNSFWLETGSNVLFTATALYTNYENISGALAAALLVYIPLSVDYAPARKEKNLLDDRVELYRQTVDEKVFDDVGLTLKGDFPVYTKKQKRNPLVSAFMDIAQLIPNPRKILNEPLNPYAYGFPGSMSYYIILTYWDIKDVFKTAFKDAAKADPNDFEVCVNNDQDTPQSIRTTLPQMGNMISVELPANPDRLAKSLDYTKRVIRTERVKAVANVVGLGGVIGFVIHSAPEVSDYFWKAVDNPTLENMALTTIWGTITAMGAGAGQHFLQDRQAIHTRLNSEGAIAARKHGASIILSNTISSIEEKIDILREEQDRSKRIQLIEEIIELYGSVDPEALKPSTREYLESLVDQITPVAKPSGHESPNTPEA